MFKLHEEALAWCIQLCPLHPFPHKKTFVGGCIRHRHGFALRTMNFYAHFCFKTLRTYSKRCKQLGHITVGFPDDVRRERSMIKGSAKRFVTNWSGITSVPVAVSWRAENGTWLGDICLKTWKSSEFIPEATEAINASIVDSELLGFFFLLKNLDIAIRTAWSGGSRIETVVEVAADLGGILSK